MPIKIMARPASIVKGSGRAVAYTSGGRGAPGVHGAPGFNIGLRKSTNPTRNIAGPNTRAKKPTKPTLPTTKSPGA